MLPQAGDAQLIAPKLKRGDRVRIVTPSRSIKLPFITPEIIELAENRLRELGLHPSYGDHIDERNFLDSSAVESRVEDLNEAFANADIRMVQSVIGGFNAGELLPHLDYGLIRRNPKVLVGYSDITALANAIYAKTGLVTYTGPHFFDFGEKQGFDYTMEYFRKCLFSSDPFEVLPSEKWSSDRWGLAQDKRNFYSNEGYVVVSKGEAEGSIIGGNLVTLASINGSPFFPPLKRDTLLFLEEDRGEDLRTFNRNLNCLMLRPDFQNVVGIVIGRFEPESGINTQKLLEVLKYHQKLKAIPIIYGVDFGHTTPKITFPVGGTCRLVADAGRPVIRIIEH
jgi:muramoyltetrapeptide carboxypeptidase LdcA involved in peptidoglycan recycling